MKAAHQYQSLPQAHESFDSPRRIEDRKSTGVDGRTHSNPTTVLASASVINAIGHQPTDAKEQKPEAEQQQEECESKKEQE